jgi:hypothetical protein
MVNYLKQLGFSSPHLTFRILQDIHQLWIKPYIAQTSLCAYLHVVQPFLVRDLFTRTTEVLLIGIVGAKRLGPVSKYRVWQMCVQLCR